MSDTARLAVELAEIAIVVAERSGAAPATTLKLRRQLDDLKKRR